MKYFLLRLLNLCLLLCVCMGYQSIAVKRAEKERKIMAEAEDKAGKSWKDGSYEGSGQGFGGLIKVRVKVEQGKILQITITEAAGEDTAYLDQAKKIIDTMLTKQSAEVDAASGATFSSKGIMAAVEEALKEAE